MNSTKTLSASWSIPNTTTPLDIWSLLNAVIPLTMEKLRRFGIKMSRQRLVRSAHWRCVRDLHLLQPSTSLDTSDDYLLKYCAQWVVCHREKQCGSLVHCLQILMWTAHLLLHKSYSHSDPIAVTLNSNACSFLLQCHKSFIFICRCKGCSC